MKNEAIILENTLGPVNNFINEIIKKLPYENSFLLNVVIHIIIASVVYLIFSQIAHIVKRSDRIFAKTSKSLILRELVRDSVVLVIKVLGLIFSLQILGAGALVGTILGAAGVLGLGISFAFKDIVENYIAGLILSIRQPFSIGDHIIVDESEGIVQRMTTRMTMIKSFDGNNTSIPNAKIFKSKITNFSKNPLRRFSFEIGINAEANPRFAQKIGLDAMQSQEEICKEPSAFSLVNKIGDSSIIVTFFGWVDQTQYDLMHTRSESICLVKEAIENAGIEIPDPSFIIKVKDNTKEKNIIKDEIVEKIINGPKELKVIQDQIKKEGLDPGLLGDQNVE